MYNVHYTTVTCGYEISGNYLPVALFLSSEGRRVTLLVTKSIQKRIQLQMYWYEEINYNVVITLNDSIIPTWYGHEAFLAFALVTYYNHHI